MEQCFVINFLTLGFSADYVYDYMQGKCVEKSQKQIQNTSQKEEFLQKVSAISTSNDLKKALSDFVRSSREGNIEKCNQKEMFLSLYRVAKKIAVDIPIEVIEHFTRK